MTPSQATLLRRILFGLIALCALIQIIVFSDQGTFFPVMIVVATGVIVIFSLVQSRVLAEYPISSLQVFGFWFSSQGLALFATTLEGVPLVTNLKMPLWTFGASSFVAVSLLAAHFIYRFGAVQVARDLLTNSVTHPLGLFRPPSPAQLWMIGIFGLFALLFARVLGQGTSITGGEVTGGGTLFKFMHGLSVFCAAPFIIPFLRAIARPTQRFVAGDFIGLALFFPAIVAIGVAANARGVIVMPLVSALFAGILLVLSGQLKITAFRSPLWIGMGVATVLLFGTITDFALAMQKARVQRGQLDASQMFALSLEIYSSPEMLKQFKEGEKRSRYSTVWDESYTSNLFINRFISTKYHDLGLDLERRLNAADRESLEKFNEARIVAIFPAPIVNALPFGFRKSAIGIVSCGDFMFFLVNGTGLGGFRTGSMIAEALGMWGWGAYPVLGITAIFVFVFSDSLALSAARRRLWVERGRQSLVVVSPAVLIGAFGIYNMFQAESYDGLLNFLFRGFWQMILLYALLMWGTGLVVGVFGLRSRKKMRPMPTPPVPG